MFYEIWRDAAGFDAHAKSTHLAEFHAMLKDVLVGPADLTFLKKLG